MKINSFGSSGSGQLYARYTDANNTYSLLFNGTQAVLQKKVAGVTTTLQTVSATSNAGTWYTVEIVAVGTTIEGWLNGVQILSATDSSLSSGYPALVANNVDASFDAVVVL